MRHKGTSESGISTPKICNYRPTRISLELSDVLVRGVGRPRLNLLAEPYVILCIPSSLFPGWENGRRTSWNILGSSRIISTAFWLSDLYSASLIHLLHDKDVLDDTIRRVDAFHMGRIVYL